MDIFEFIVILFWVCVGCVAVFIVLGATFLGGIGGATGQHVGFVTAVEDANNLVWDSTLVYFKSSTESTQEDVYCVNDQPTRELLETLQESGSRVKVNFHNNFLMWKSQCNGGISIITGATLIE